MRTSSKIATAIVAGIAIITPVIMDEEGYENMPYYDQANVLTVCYGHTGEDVHYGKAVSAQGCKVLLQKDLQVPAEELKRDIKVEINEYEAAAYLSFTYNVGIMSFRTSTLLKKLNAGDHAGACAELKRWVYVGDIRNRGLINRRASEYRICMQDLE